MRYRHRLGAVNRMVAALVATCLAIGLAACGAEPDESGPITLTVSTWAKDTDEMKDWWPALAADFEADHPGVTIEVQQVPFTEYQSQLTTRLIAGESPDVIHVPTPSTMLPVWADAGFLLDLDAFLAGTDILEKWPDSQQAMTWQGATYGVLLVDYGYMLFYNEDMLTKAGVEVPTTADELVAAARAVTDMEGDAYGFTIAADNSTNLIRDMLIFVAGDGAQIAKDGHWNLTDEKVVAAVDRWRILGRDLAPGGTDISQKREAYVAGNVAMMIEGPFYYTTAQSTAGNEIKDSLKMALPPFEATPGDVSHGMAVPKGLSDRREKLALDFVEYAASDASMTLYSKEATSPVARPGSGDALRDDPQTALVAQAAAEDVPILDPNLEGVRRDYSEFSDITGIALHTMLDGERPTKDVMAELQQELEKEGVTP